MQIDLLDEASIPEWLSTSADVQPSDVAALADQLRSNGPVRRYIVREGGNPMARFSVDLAPRMMTIWWPTLLGDIDALHSGRVYSCSLDFILDLARTRATCLIECTLKDPQQRFSPWREHLLKAGFRSTCWKREWVCKLSARDSVVAEQSASRIQRWSGTRSDLEALYVSTLAHSSDRSAVLEARYGILLGLADDMLFVMGDRGEALGLHALLQQPESASAWNKYIGIVPEARRQEVGTKLLVRALSTQVDAGFNVSRSLIDEANQPSIALHQRVGFTPTQMLGETLHYEYDPVEGMQRTR